MRFFVIATLALAAAAVPARADHGTPIGDGAASLPIFDAHVHYKEPAWQRYPVESVIELMDRNGVAMALVSSTPDEGTIMLWQYAPKRIVPELRPYHDDVGSSNWTKAPDIDAYLERRLAAYPHEGIGEFHIHRLDTSDEPLFRQVIAMAKARDIPLHVHAGAAPIRWLYGLDPDVKLIWAHTGLGERPDTIHALMSEFPALYADTSLRDVEILGSGDALSEGWKRILFDFQDRLMLGSDTWVTGQWDRYDDIIAIQRQWLALLPRDVAEKIAYRNAEKLFNRTITNDLIGTR